MTFLLPTHPGLLPFWLLFTAALSLWNTIACHHGKSHILRSYQGPSASSQITDFAARMSGTSTLLSFAVRACAAYKVHNPELYFIAQWTFGVALLHFVGELLLFRTMRLGLGVVPVMTVATVGTVWMSVQRSFYLGRSEWQISQRIKGQ